MSRDSDIIAARARAAQARRQLSGSVDDLLSRFTPSGLASQAFAGVRKGNVDWLGLGFKLYRYRGTAVTLLGLVASLKARKRRKEAQSRAREAEQAATTGGLWRRKRNGQQRGWHEGAEQMANSLKETADVTRERVRAASEKATKIRDRASDKAEAVLSSTRERGQRAGGRIVETIKANPVTAIAGGLAVGVLAAAFIPGFRKKSGRAGSATVEALDRYRVRATEGARETLHVISEKLDDLGVNKEQARETVEKARLAAQDVTSIAAAAARDALHRIKRDF